MRIMIKGGVWKNTEDEILKAAVMKYGLNQWARISSLLVRKSAKQCKARWYEWLDPAIKKTEWTREEDEKLLHLAKLMPCQWRTIAPIVGRTPAQCLERYEKLLDMAVSKDERYDPKDDPRRLRPGEIDPHPESKPARPDAVDMEEDEKEMLSEARARLANTRGKKAKRKAREKQMEEARRLAALQKKRELKAAGIDLPKRDRRMGINYSEEVAFEKKPQAGFFDTGEEGKRTKEISTEFRPVTVEELEGKKRRDVEEALVKRDIKRAKMLERNNLPAALDQAQDDPAAARRRFGRMMLPAPQITENELEQIARMSNDAGLDEALAEGAGGEATRELLGTYGPTPLRPAGGLGSMMPPPRTAPTGDRIMMEAQNQLRLSQMATPLLGGDNPELHPSDFAGVTPRAIAAATPNPLAASMTPGATPAGAPGATPSMLGATGRRTTAIAGVPMSPSALGATPGRGGDATSSRGMPMSTPMRDQLGLNDADAMVVGGGKRAVSQRQQALRSELRAGLAQLPAPQNEYQIVAPEAAPEDDDQGDAMEEDAADAKARKEREAEERRQAEERKKSKALQRSLPRPAAAPPGPAHRGGDPSRMSYRERAEDALVAELSSLMQYEAAKYPIKEPSKSEKKKEKLRGPAPGIQEIDDFNMDEMLAAEELLAKEREFVIKAMGHATVAPSEYMDAWQQLHKDLIYVPSKGGHERSATASAAERCESYKADYDAARSEMEAEAKRAAKVEQKVNILVGGLKQRDTKLRQQLDTVWGELEEARMELACFRALAERELRAAPERIERMQELVQQQREREKLLQDRYKLAERDVADLQELALQRGQQQALQQAA